jgi:Fe-S-cluster-containing hydrogenase component 2
MYLSDGFSIICYYCLLICPSNEVVQNYRMNEKVSSIKCSNFSTILPIVSVTGIDRSGKPEANVAWKLFKKDPP